MRFKIAICDDDEKNIQQLHTLLLQFMFQKKCDYDVMEFISGKALLDTHIEAPFDIIFLDIELKKENGIEIARTIREQGRNSVYIVFVTMYPQYMQHSFEVQPFNFLTKPISYVAVEEVLLAIIKNYNNTHITQLLVDEAGTEHSILIKDVLYMRAQAGKTQRIEYVLEDRTLTGKGTIQEWEAKLKDYGFLSPCRGYLVNLRHVHAIHTDITLKNGACIPVSRRKADEIKELLINRVIHITN